MKPGEAYGALDRSLHHFAFTAISAQLALADIETGIYRKTLSRIPAREPVFITSLPRAGTTLLLEVLSTLPDFAAHTYRVMPFVLCPMVWDRISRPFRRTAEATERAHGDGVAIGYDSPEAFEEVAWLRFWKSHYDVDRILPWTQDDGDDEFESFLRDHMRKIIALRAADSETSGGDLPTRRYLSKNNANIARLDLLTAMFPDCRIVIPIRNPWDHAASMYNQHQRFTHIHATDGFSRRYMQWLGHFEFGAAHRPIDFNGWRSAHTGYTPSDREYWLTYWYECYAHVLEANSAQLVFVDYDRLCAEPRRSLAAIASALNIGHEDQLLAKAEKFRRATQYDETPSCIDRALADRTQAIYVELQARAL